MLLALTAQPIQQEEKPSLQCDIGGIDKQFGGNNWVAYACNDGRTFVMFSKADNPATPFYFIIYWKDGGYGIAGEGTGDQQASSGAFEELKSMTQAELAALNSEIRASAASSATE
jgi:hypothetical protein